MLKSFENVQKSTVPHSAHDATISEGLFLESISSRPMIGQLICLMISHWLKVTYTILTQTNNNHRLHAINSSVAMYSKDSG